MQEAEYKINITRRGLLSWEYEVKRKRPGGGLTAWEPVKYGRMPTKHLAMAVGRYRAYLERRQVQWFKESLTINI